MRVAMREGGGVARRYEGLGGGFGAALDFPPHCWEAAAAEGSGEVPLAQRAGQECAISGAALRMRFSPTMCHPLPPSSSCAHAARLVRSTPALNQGKQGRITPGCNSACAVHVRKHLECSG